MPGQLADLRLQPLQRHRGRIIGDLDHAIWACFANARTAREKQQHPAGPADRRADVTVYEPEDCDERYRQYLEHAPRRTGPTLIPIQV